MSNRLNYNFEWILGIYEKKLGQRSWLPTPKRGYRLYDVLSNDSISLDDKFNAIIGRLEQLALEDQRYNFSEEENQEHKINFWKHYRSRFDSTWLNEHNGRRILHCIWQNSAFYDYIDAQIIKMIKKLYKRLDDIDSEQAQNLFDEVIAIQNQEMQILPPLVMVKRPGYDGKWRDVCEDNAEWIRYGRHDNKAMPIDVACKDPNELNFGFECEGTFPSESKFQECMTKLSQTPFEGGFLMDSRNWAVPTSDPTIHNGFNVEWVFAPFKAELGKKYLRAFFEVLLQYEWDGEYKRHGSGIHCHIDAHCFNDKTLKNLIDEVYDTTKDAKMKLYQQGPTYNNWNKSSSYCIDRRVIELDSYNEDGDQLAVIKKVIVAGDRSTLLNLRNFRRNNNGTFKGTLELRGWNGSCLPHLLIDQIDAICKKALSK